MASPNLPVTIDEDYSDSGRVSVKAHQQHHDLIGQVVNQFDKDAVPADGDVLSWNAGTGLWVPVDFYGAVRDAVALVLQAGGGGEPPTGAPVAAFTADPLTGSAPLTVQFENLTSGSPTSYSWNFGDGSVSVLANPSHEYEDGGNFTVSLTSTNASGSNTMTRAAYIEVTLVADTPVTIGTPTIGNGFVTITWSAYPGATTYKVGRNGVDTDGAGAWEESVTGLTWTANKLINSTSYTLHVIPVVNGADGPTSTVNATPLSGSVEPPPPGTDPGTRTVPLIGRSGLTWNSIVFRGGGSETYPQFESWRGRPVDGVMVFPYRAGNWNDMSATIPRRSGDLMVWAVSPFVQGSGVNNANVASGAQDGNIASFAQRLAAAGWNTSRTVIRLGWENNGNWYEWGWDRGGVDAFKNAFRKWVTVCRANGLSNVIWDWCLNKGPQSYNSGYSWQTGYPGDDVVDVIGIDSYDFYSASFNETQWSSNVTAGKNPGLDGVLAFCQSHNKLIALDEWGVCHGTGGGGDNAWYIGRMHDWLKANAAWVAWEVTYDHPGNPGLNHMLSDGSNPNAAARYRQAWPNGWG